MGDRDHWLWRIASGAVADQRDVTDTPEHVEPVLAAVRAAYRAGAEAMRERAAALVDAHERRSLQAREPSMAAARLGTLLAAIRALPVEPPEGT